MVCVVSYGGGVNSTALLIEMEARGMKPDLILFANTGGEFPATYQYVELFSGWLKQRGFPPVTVVRNGPRTLSKTLEGECLKNKTLPSKAFGYAGCSVKWKRQPMDRYIRDEWEPAKAAWLAGEKVERIIGIDAGEAHRGKIPDDGKFHYRFPLIEWDIDRDDCMEIISMASLPVPPKSACWFCPAMKKREVKLLARQHPDFFRRAVEMEKNAAPNLGTVKGLGRAYSWEELVAGDEAQTKLFPEAFDEACVWCFDGSDDE